MAGAALGMMCVILVIAVPIGLCLGALILMGAVAIANKCLPQPRSRSAYYDDDDDDDDDDGWDAPPRRRRRSAPTRSAIPTPAFGHAVLIVFVTWIVSFVIGLVLGFVAGGVGMGRNQGGQLLIQGCSAIINLAVSATVITSMLPTTFPRACLVVLFQFLICLAIAMVIVVPLLVLGVGLGNLR